MKAFSLQVCPDCIHVRNVEDQPPPASPRTTLLQIEDRTLFVLSAKRREIPVFPAVDDFHPEHISVEPHGVCHTSHLKCHGRNLFNIHPHLTSHGSSPQTSAVAYATPRGFAACAMTSST